MYEEKDFVYLVTYLEVLSSWRFADCTYLKNKSNNIKNKIPPLLLILRSSLIIVSSVESCLGAHVKYSVSKSDNVSIFDGEGVYCILTF